MHKLHHPTWLVGSTPPVHDDGISMHTSSCCTMACSFCAAGCQAERQLQCSGDLGLGGHKVLALPRHNLVLGHVQLQNRGPRPLPLNKAGFKLSGMGGPIDGDLRCPGLNIPAGGSLQVSTQFFHPKHWDSSSRSARLLGVPYGKVQSMRQARAAGWATQHCLSAAGALDCALALYK